MTAGIRTNTARYPRGKGEAAKASMRRFESGPRHQPSGVAFEARGRLKPIFLDKTVTLTVTEIHTASGVDEYFLLEAAATAERNSEPAGEYSGSENGDGRRSKF